METPSGTAVRQLSVFLQNRVGALLALVRLLRDRHIEVLGLSVQDSTEMTLVRLILSDPDTAGTLFMEKGIPHVSLDVVVVELREGEHDLTHALAPLVAAEVNIHFIYPLMARPRAHPVMVLQCDDGEVGGSVLMAAGFRVLMQEDLSR
ncbi:MAG: acetolactate synthase [Verrucomicrobiales bacterium]|nr:acetolactate synthase [Verrucomicrobiales bacterium]